MLDYTDKRLDLDEIVFENRNHEYGAYELRRRYEGRVRAAIAWATSGLAVLALIPIIGMRMPKENAMPVSDSLVIDFTPIDRQAPPDVPPIPPMPEPLAAPKVPEKTVVFNEPVIDPNESTIPDQDTLKDHVIVSSKPETVPGDAGDGVEVITGAPGGQGDGKGPGPASDLGLGGSNDAFDVVEQMPDPGYNVPKELAGNIHYPNDAIRNNITGQVFVEFIIEPDGSISNVKLLKGIGYGCDEEAVRVVSEMPAWHPGKQNGRPVRVRSRVPLRFRLKEGN